MATLNLEPTLSTRYGITRVMYRGRDVIKEGSYTTPQPKARARDGNVFSVSTLELKV